MVKRTYYIIITLVLYHEFFCIIIDIKSASCIFIQDAQFIIFIKYVALLLFLNNTTKLSNLQQKITKKNAYSMQQTSNKHHPNIPNLP